MIRPVTLDDAPAIADIYNYYVQNTVVTFEEKPVKVSDVTRRINEVVQNYPWLVFEEEEKVVGYAYAKKWKARTAYRFAVEATIYVLPDKQRKGIGRELYTSLIEQLRNKKIHSILGGIALPNKGSVKLHESFGFVKIAEFKEVGWKFDKWVSVGYWELIL
jgi:L-amino acid N-acyltransferase YncA